MTPLTIAATIGIIVGVFLFAYGYHLNMLNIQIIGIIISITSLLIGYIRPLISNFLGGPKVDIDLIYALLHMRSVASGKAPPGKVLASVSDPDMYKNYSKTFGRAVLLAREWGYNLSEALAYLAKEIKEKAFREVVQRLSATIRLGADLEEFLETEYNTLLHEYQYHYQRMLNNMRLLLGVYVAIMAALVFALSSFTLLGFFFGDVADLLVQAYIAGLMVVTGIGAVIILLLPREYFDVRGKKARENKLVRMIDVSAILGVIIGMLMAIYYIRTHTLDTRSISIALVLMGIPTLPAGLLVLKLESTIHDIDIFFPVFIRSLGSYLSTIPSLKQALSQILRADLGKLTKLITRFHVRLENEIPPHVAWKRFAIESGSELVRRGARIFQDTIEYGGNTNLAGRLISDHNNTLLALRRLRAQISSNFTSTAIVVHASVVAISIFIIGLVDYFNTVLTGIMSQLTAEVTTYFFLSPINIEFIYRSIFVYISALTIINTYLITLVRPFSIRAFWLYYSVLMIVTGISSYFSAWSVDYILRTMAGIQPPVPVGPTP